jgi:hypothetical protein
MCNHVTLSPKTAGKDEKQHRKEHSHAMEDSPPVSAPELSTISHSSRQNQSPESVQSGQSPHNKSPKNAQSLTAQPQTLENEVRSAQVRVTMHLKSKVSRRVIYKKEKFQVRADVRQKEKVDPR